MKYLLTIVCCMYSILGTYAQKSGGRLSIGDTVPDLVLNNMINYQSTKAKLSDFKGKAIILDFWNKSCGSCIAAMPKMQKLQERFKDDLVILLVNDVPKDTREQLQDLYLRSSIFRNTTLPMVLGDSTFSNGSTLFPHYGVPYHVWIDKNRVIMATTTGESATSENVRALIAGETPDVVKRVDLEKDEVDLSSRNKPLLEISNGIFKGHLLYFNKRPSYEKGQVQSEFHTLFFDDPIVDKGNLSRMAMEPKIKNSNGAVIGQRVTGSLSLLFFMSRLSTKPMSAGIIYKVVPEAGIDPVNLDRRMGYEYMYPGGQYNDSLYRQVLREDLETFTGLSGHVEFRTLKCRIFYRTDGPLKLKKQNPDNPDEKGEYILLKHGFRGLIRDCGLEDLTGPVVLNETGIEIGMETGKVYRAIEDKLGKARIEQLKIGTVSADHEVAGIVHDELSKYGIGLKEEYRQLPVLVLKKR